VRQLPSRALLGHFRAAPRIAHLNARDSTFHQQDVSSWLPPARFSRLAAMEAPPTATACDRRSRHRRREIGGAANRSDRLSARQWIRGHWSID